MRSWRNCVTSLAASNSRCSMSPCRLHHARLPPPLRLRAPRLPCPLAPPPPPCSWRRCRTRLHSSKALSNVNASPWGESKVRTAAASTGSDGCVRLFPHIARHTHKNSSSTAEHPTQEDHCHCSYLKGDWTDSNAASTSASSSKPVKVARTSILPTPTSNGSDARSAPILVRGRSGAGPSAPAHATKRDRTACRVSQQP